MKFRQVQVHDQSRGRAAALLDEHDEDLAEVLGRLSWERDYRGQDRSVDRENRQEEWNKARSRSYHRQSSCVLIWHEIQLLGKGKPQVPEPQKYLHIFSLDPSNWWITTTSLTLKAFTTTWLDGTTSTTWCTTFPKRRSSQLHLGGKLMRYFPPMYQKRKPNL